MSKLVNIAALVLVAAFAVSDASAQPLKTVTISGTHTREEIGRACKAVGGIQGNTTSGNHGDYECTNTNKGTAIHCNDAGQCTGTVPG